MNDSASVATAITDFGTHGALEWLDVNEGGSFAMGSADRVPRRKYHSALVIREPGMGEPLHAIADITETVSIGGRWYSLNAFEYDGAPSPGSEYLERFEYLPCPTWTYRVEGLTVMRRQRLDPTGDAVWLTYDITGVTEPVDVVLQPFLTFRPMDGLTFENEVLDGTVNEDAGGVAITPYPQLPTLVMRVDGVPSTWESHGDWYRRVRYSTEEERGYDAHEDYFTPGVFTLRLAADATFSFVAGVAPLSADMPGPPANEDALDRAARQFVLRRKDGEHGIIAGYPWFGEWGRDTLISLPGLCIATGRFDEARAILRSYANQRVNGLVPNMPATTAKEANLNSIDASLFYIRAAQWLRMAAGTAAADEFAPVVRGILDAVMRGGDPRVTVTEDGELRIARGPWSLTWMDAVVDGWPVTPRHDFVVDINALFYNSLGFAIELARSAGDPAWAASLEPVFERAQPAFMRRFWLPDAGYLADSHDGDEPDPGLRPNQLWAIGLPYSPVPDEEARSAVEAVRRSLLTPVGLRTLGPDDPRYRGRIAGTQRERDLSYHQGTVWPWLLGAYADAVARVDGPDAARIEMRPVIDRLLGHLHGEACLGQISEVFDGDHPHAPAGAPAQAWSVAELLRAARALGVAADRQDARGDAPGVPPASGVRAAPGPDVHAAG